MAHGRSRFYVNGPGRWHNNERNQSRFICHSKYRRSDTGPITQPFKVSIDDVRIYPRTVCGEIATPAGESASS